MREMFVLLQSAASESEEAEDTRSDWVFVNCFNRMQHGGRRVCARRVSKWQTFHQSVNQYPIKGHYMVPEETHIHITAMQI